MILFFSFRKSTSLSVEGKFGTFCLSCRAYESGSAVGAYGFGLAYCDDKIKEMSNKERLVLLDAVNKFMPNIKEKMGMEDAFGEISERLTSIFTAFKVDQIADTLTDSAESYTKNLRDIQNIRGYNDEQLDGLREELGQYVQQIHDSGGKLSINEYSENVQQWVEHGFRDDMASSMGMQQDLMEKTLGVDISQIEDLVDQMWYSGYDVVGLTVMEWLPNSIM